MGFTTARTRATLLLAGPVVVQETFTKRGHPWERANRDNLADGTDASTRIVNSSSISCGRMTLRGGQPDLTLLAFSTIHRGIASLPRELATRYRVPMAAIGSSPLRGEIA